MAHSLGGLVCEDVRVLLIRRFNWLNKKQALVTSNRSVEQYLRNVLKCTFGVAFMGTPHHGSDQAKWAETIRKLISPFKQTNHEILQTLKHDSEILSRIQDEFHTLLRAQRDNSRPLNIVCFYEELPLAIVGMVR